MRGRLATNFKGSRSSLAEFLPIPLCMYTSWYFTWCVGMVPCFDTSVNGTAVTAAAQLQSRTAADSAAEEQHPSRQWGRYRVTALP